MKLSSEHVVIFFLSISIMLVLARLLGEAFNRIKQPAIIGEILAGIILGPTILGTLLPGVYNALFPESPELEIAMDGITTMAVSLLLLVAGLEVDLALVIKEGKTALSTSIMGIVFPFALGFGVSYLFPQFMGIEADNKILAFSLFMGTAMSISALPVIARILMDLNIFKTQIGFIIISSAMLNDLLGWIIFSIILGMLGSGITHMSFLETMLLTLGFVAVTLTVVKYVINLILPKIQKNFSYPGGVLNLIMALAFLGAAFTEYIGIHAIFGSFLMGIAIGDSANLKERTRDIIQQFVNNIFAPLFFISIGLRVNFILNFDLPLVLLFLIIAFAGKVIGCGLGAYWSGVNKYDSVAIGFGMNSRGAMEIILGLIALQYGLIQEKVFVALVVMALVTSISSAPVMNYILNKNKKWTLKDILSPDTFAISTAADKKGVIIELVERASKRHKLLEEELFYEVWKREQLVATGIGNYVAIPHAKVDIKKPIAILAINKEGVDFEAPDKLPAKIILLLLTPKDDHEIQLRLLAEIANLIKDRNKAEDILSLQSKEDIIHRFLN
jgi:Kef-type K+ transport system membrane component KefB/mannitol/fructose-specific phosphotransferase system IIA component (Ntr-type)